MRRERRHRPVGSRFTRLVAETLEPRLALAVLPTLITDLNQQPAGISAPFQAFAELEGVAYFGGSAGGGQSGLWRSDGASSGTQKVSDVQVFGEMLAIGQTIYFPGLSETNTLELWKTDGTTQGTIPIADVLPGPRIARIAHLTHVGGTIFFTALVEETGTELWKTDGTAAGTVLVKDIVPGFLSSDPNSLTNVDGTLFFSARTDESGRELWKSDGTAAGTVLVRDINPLAASSMDYDHVRNFVNVNGVLLFTANDGVLGRNLWRSDGTPFGTTLVTDFGISSLAGVSDFHPFQTVGSKTVFVASQDDGVRQLWVSDGTQPGTVRISDFGPFDFLGQFIPRSTAEVVFSLSDSNGEWRLWKTNGSAIGTLPFGPNMDDEPTLMTAGTKLLFTSPDPSPGINLWTSDGTDQGTSFIQNIDPGPRFGFSQFSGRIGGRAFFNIFRSAIGYEVWSSDGTAAGTVRLQPSGGGTASSTIFVESDRAVLGNQLFFSASNGLSGNELWKTDGTATGTVLVKDIVPGPGSGGPEYMVRAGSKLFFVANDGVHGRELWVSDGTALGTKMVVDANAGPESSSVANMTEVNGQLFFALSRNGDTALARTDGTEAGTVIIPTVQPSSFIGKFFANVNGVLFFSGAGSDGGDELWKSDGTELGTVSVKDINPGPPSSYPSGLVAVGSRLFFRASDGTSGDELWTSLGTPESTVLVKDIRPGKFGSFPYYVNNVNGTLFFTAHDEQGARLWKSSGTEAGTVPLTQDLFSIRDLTAVGNTLFFQAFDDQHGTELWKSDGTQAGTVLVKDLIPGPASRYLSQLTNVAGTLFFRSDSDQGSQIWQSDGTSAGTKPFLEFPERFQFGPLHRAGTRLIFDGRTSQFGDELYSARLVNIAPSFTKGPNIDATDEDGPTERPAWATVIAPGPADESPQATQFLVETSNPAIFTTPPAIDASGRLTFTPKPNVSGFATITVRLRDDGGTLLSGSDTSAPETFVISVTKPHPLHNAINGLDVTLDNNILASDALAVINHINAFGLSQVPPGTVSAAPYLDVVPDNNILPADALAIINHINAFGPTIGAGEGEPSVPPSPASSLSSDLLTLLALDIGETFRPRRR